MDKKGFTLTEMIAVIVIVGIVIIIAIPASRRLIINNQQEKINNEQRVVEKAMIAYAETDQRKMNCVRMTIKDLVDNGYLIRENLVGTGYNPDDSTTAYYYYKGKISDAAPSGVTCGIVESSSSSAIDNNEEEQVIVAETPDSVPVVGDIYTLNVTRTDSTYYNHSINPIKITMWTDDRKFTVTCEEVDTCSLELQTAINDSVADTAYSWVRYTIYQDYYGKPGTATLVKYENEYLFSNSETGNEFSKTVSLQPRIFTGLSKKISSDFLKDGYEYNGSSSYSADLNGRVLSANISGEVITCLASGGKCERGCRQSTATVRLGENNYFFNNKTFAAGTSSWIEWKNLKPITHISTDCFRSFSESAVNYSLEDDARYLYVKYDSPGGMNIVLNYSIIRK